MLTFRCLSADLACIVPAGLTDGQQALVACRVQMEHLNMLYMQAPMEARRQEAREDR